MEQADKGAIIIADDNADLIEVLTRVVSSLGYRALTAVDGKEALDLLLEPDLKCAVFDVKMPLKDGFQLLEFTLRQERKIPVILMSAEPYDREEVILRGAKDFLHKPFPLKNFLNVLSRIIEEFSSRERRRYNRITIRLPIFINDINGNEYHGFSLDIGQGGIKFTISTKDAAIAGQFSLNVHFIEKQVFLKKVSKVWERPSNGNRFLVGGEFEEISNESARWLKELEKELSSVEIPSTSSSTDKNR